jgi:two-component system cell cycle sensor histidine kinase/response regulator CckA
MQQHLAQATRAHPAHALTRNSVESRRKKAIATILLVEHHPLFLKLIRKILEDAQYSVLSASNPKEAKEIEGSFEGPIDLLLTEVMMTPGLLGTKLAKALKKRRPKMRILLMSAYPGGELLVLNYGWHFIKHPFMAEGLVGRIKDVLHSKIREQGTDHFDTRK